MQPIVNYDQWKAITEEQINKQLELGNLLPMGVDAISDISENQLKFLIKENQGVLKLNLGKEEDRIKLENFCKPVLINKTIIDKYNKKVDSEVLKYLTKLKNEYTKKYPDISNYLLDVEKISSDVAPLMSSSVKNTMYTYYGHSNYNDSEDINLIFKKISTSVDNLLQGNFVKKTAIKVFITKKNVNGVKNGVEQFFNEFKRATHWIRVVIPALIRADIRKEHDMTGTKCTNIIITNDTYGNKVTPYNPTKPPITKNLKHVETETLLNPYIVSVNKLIDSFV